MGNACNGSGKQDGEEEILPTKIGVPPLLDGDLSSYLEESPVIQWERHQQELNEEVMQKMREEFHNRPDNFILNLLVVSVQFYSNYEKEKVEIRNHIHDREMAFDRKLEQSKRKVLYMGGHEEISGSHVLYQPRGEPYMEVPTPLQFYVVHDNVDIYPETQYEELQGRQYTDLDGPGYRFCTEYSKRHPGYVRLRCVDIIPGVTRSNTYEDIYGFLKPVDETQPDPVVDPRPLRRTSLTNDSDIFANGELSQRSSLYSEFEESDDESSQTQSPPISPTKLNGPSLAGTNRPLQNTTGGRRHSGVLPNGYPRGGDLKHILTAMQSVEESSEEKSNVMQNGDVGMATPRHRSPLDRRPSGLFPRVGPEMRRLRLTSKRTDTTESRLMVEQRLESVIEEEEEEEENNGSENMSSDNHTGTSGLHPGETLEEVKEDEGEEGNESRGEVRKDNTIILHARLNKGCFLNRNIKIKDPQDVYGISTRTERRTYFSSERHMECFEDEFEDLTKVLGKEHLLDTSQRHGPAVTANELMIEEIGPKFYTEFIPTVMLQEWPNCAFEWPMRERKGRFDHEKKLMYKWPKEINVREATQMGCNLVPIGHYNPREPNRVMKIEWQIQFIKAEQILLRSLGHVQIRLLLWVEYLLRDHLGDIPSIQNQHLRYILFWMCEKNFRDWQEPRLGIKLKAFLKTLYNSLSTESLPHYFVSSCNLMKNIPDRYIRLTQATIKKMKENLPVYVMHTISRMRLASDFYPKLNVRKLFNLVTKESFGLEMLNPQLLQVTDGEGANKAEDEDDVYRSDSENEDGDAEEKRQLHELRLKRQLQAMPRQGRDNNNTLHRTSSINLDTKIQKVKDLRAGPVLKLFARHFLAMARASNCHRAYPQAYTYLLLAGNMATLLDETGNNDDARAFRRQVEELNVASRGGVMDMLGSTWRVNEQHDLVSNNGPPRGPNWELSEPPAQPKEEHKPVFGINHVQTASSLRNLSPKIHRAAVKKSSLKKLESELNDLQTEDQSTLPSTSSQFPASFPPSQSSTSLTSSQSSSSLPSEAPSPSPPSQYPSPALPSQLPSPSPPSQDFNETLQSHPEVSHQGSASSSSTVPSSVSGSEVPDTPSSDPPNLVLLKLTHDDTDEEDDSTDL